MSDYNPFAGADPFADRDQGVSGGPFGNSATLLRSARSGSQEALNVLFERVGERLLGLIRLRLSSTVRTHVDSSDLLQTTLLRAFAHFEQFQGADTAALIRWLSRIARNEVFRAETHWRRDRRDVERTVALGQEAPELVASLRSQISRLVKQEEKAQLEAALAALSEEHREVILARKYEELSFPEIGERLGRSANAARMLFARAMAALTRELEARQ